MRLVPSYDRQPVTAEEEAYSYLLDAICKGQYRTGDRLIAEDIANDIGMSRMPVREAFRRLAAEGLVTLRPNRGAIVSGLNIEEMREVFEMRSALEGLAIRLAVPKLGERQLARLERLLDEMDDYRDDSAEWVSRHRVFHEYLCSLAERPRLRVPHVEVGAERVRQHDHRRPLRPREVVVDGQVSGADERHG